MLFGYNTNGFAHHRLDDVLRILADLGYGSVALTIDYHALNPYEPDLLGRVDALRRQLQSLKLRSVIETGARFLLDPWRKHQPTLLSARSEDRLRRLDFLRHAVGIAAELGADAVSFWSGRADDDAPEAVHMQRLRDGCLQLCETAHEKRVRLAFEPEPGMFIDTMARFATLHEQIQHPAFGLTMDIGHLHCQGEVPLADHVQRWAPFLWNIHIEDMRRGVHDHLMFGEGEMDFRLVLQALEAIGFGGGVHVELSRHSHDAVETARRALSFLQAALATNQGA